LGCSREARGERFDGKWFLSKHRASDSDEILIVLLYPPKQ
jgi:hypothetical protein